MNGLRSSTPSGIVSGITSGTKEESVSAEKVRENRARRVAERQGLQLVKSRRRDPRALEYGLYSLLSVDTGALVCSPRWVTLEAAEHHLDRPVRP